MPVVPSFLYEEGHKVSEIIRRSIKVRKSIHRDFCTCYDAQVFSVCGVPYLVSVDKMDLNEFQQMVGNVNVMVPVLMSEHIPDSWDKAVWALGQNIPVILTTKHPLQEDRIEALSQVPRSSVQIAVEFPKDTVREKLSPESSNPFSFFESLHAGKSKKVSQVLEIDWYPHLSDPLDWMEVIEAFKNYVNHVVVKFPVINDMLYRAKIQEWEQVVPQAVHSFKGFYEADVESRSWVVKPLLQEEMISQLASFIRSKKLTLELIEWDDSLRVRHSPVYSDNAFGIRPVLYAKEGDKFVPSETVEESICTECGKTIL
ncbi:hypothetical protein D3C73_817480 [compost metagenome]